MKALAAFFSLLCITLYATPAVGQESKLDRLLARTPSVANAVLYIHAPTLQKLMDDAEYNTPLSDQIEEVWAVANLDTLSMLPQWEAGYATLDKELDAQQLAEGLNGYVDSVGGVELTRTPKQTYLVPMPNGLGFLRPANRSLLARWLAPTGGSGLVSNYLAAQAKQPEQYLSLLFAIDLENVVSPIALQPRIASLSSIGDANAEEVARLLASVRGISIIVGRESLQQCILAIEFQESPAMLAPFARDLLNEILNKNGTGAPEVMTWDVRVEDNKLTFQGAISENTLDAVLNILSLRGQADAVADAMATTEEIDGPRAYESKKYFDRVQALIKRVRDYDAQSTGYRAKWNEQNARRIDELGTVGVNEDLVAYGRQVSRLLRENAAAIRGVNVQAGRLQASQSLSDTYSYGYYGSGYSNYGYYDPNSTSDYQQAAGAQARMSGFGSFRNTMTQIDELTADIRQKMTKLYNTQF